MNDQEIDTWAKLKVQLTLMRCAVRAVDCVVEVRYLRELDEEAGASTCVSRSPDRGAGRQA